MKKINFLFFLQKTSRNLPGLHLVERLASYLIALSINLFIYDNKWKISFETFFRYLILGKEDTF